MGASLSLRTFARLGKKMSVVDFAIFGSSLSLRRFSRVGQRISIQGETQVGGSLSVVDLTTFGGSVALRGFSRMGSTLSLFSFVQFGASMSVRSFVRFGSSVSVEDGIHFGAANTNIKHTSGGNLEITVDSHRSLSATASGGVLHGTWSSDASTTTSDRRLKKNIMPLYKAFSEGKPEATVDRQGTKTGDRKENVGWILRQLRPVSFQFRSGPEGKYSRYGFVAQELQQVLPAVVRGQGERHLSVVYQDLIALLTLAAQNLQDKVNKQEETMAAMMAHIKALDDKLERLLGRQQEQEQQPGQLQQQQQILLLEKKIQQQEEQLQQVRQLQKQQHQRHQRAQQPVFF